MTTANSSRVSEAVGDCLVDNDPAIGRGARLARCRVTAEDVAPRDVSARRLSESHGQR